MATEKTLEILKKMKADPKAKERKRLINGVVSSLPLIR